MLQTLISEHGLDDHAARSVWELTSVFYTRNLKTEMVFCVPFTEYRDDDVIDIAYTIRYPEWKPMDEEWTIRQTGVYHRLNTRTKQSLYIIFNPTPGSKLHKSLVLSPNDYSGESRRSLVWVHQKLFATYMPAWRYYIASLERRFLPIANTAAATYINEELRIGHGHLSSLISIEKDFLQIPTIVAAAADVITALRTLMSDLQAEQGTQQLQNMQRQCETYSRTAAHLQQRVQVTAQLLADTLLFRDQVLANEQNGNMLQLNRSAVFLTTLTLLYLPASFLTSFFGMNFFAMDQTDNKIVGTSMIWIFVVSAILLTVATFIMYNWLSSHDTFFRTMAPKKWMTADLNLRKLTRRFTGSKMDGDRQTGV
ncbi:conserved hypothetical protein [Talaromyces stipitatus ATCC 10500]|uniref:CorA family metal ion transporter n=1 Tax=Talaromyces stipitatus (strain ATCC 10500 / CBS 375.48 / QM 6759 / NRRL 1006) TaxID=441959 RepID=B8M3X5_TALSN|nr:uncharacterized protein TSTA_039200 [Talaromyces stipitatus ATCC 10500]EED20719.1 conserved hypothetical protein [Talaromyces stipitatus ATCC 10500]